MSEAFIASTCCCKEDDDDDDKETDPPICDKPGSEQPPGATCEPIKYLLVAGKIKYDLSGKASFKTTGLSRCRECFTVPNEFNCLDSLPEVSTTYDNELSYEYAQVFNGKFKALMEVDMFGNAVITNGPNGQYPPRLEYEFGTQVENYNRKAQVSTVCPLYQGAPLPFPYVAGSVAYSEFVDNQYISDTPYARVYAADGSDPFFSLKRDVIYRSCDSTIGDQIYACEDLPEGCYVRWTFGGQFSFPLSTVKWQTNEAYEDPYGIVNGIISPGQPLAPNITVSTDCAVECGQVFDTPAGFTVCPVEGFVFRTYAYLEPEESTCPKQLWERPRITRWGFMKNDTNPVYSQEVGDPCNIQMEEKCRGLSTGFYAASGWPGNVQFNYGRINHFGRFDPPNQDVSIWFSNSCSPNQDEDAEGEPQGWTSPNFFFLPVFHWSDDCEGVCIANGQNHTSVYEEEFEFKCVPFSATGGPDPCPCFIYGETGEFPPANNSCDTCRGLPDALWNTESDDNVKIYFGTHTPLEADELPDPASW